MGVVFFLKVLVETLCMLSCLISNKRVTSSFQTERLRKSSELHEDLFLSLDGYDRDISIQTQIQIDLEIPIHGWLENQIKFQMQT